jgi:glucose/arabinose dehydrogenase
MADLADGTGRMLVLEQGGVIWVVEQGNLLPEPYLDLRDRVGATANERGLLGIALHPRFIENHYFYLNYTDKQGNTVIGRYTAPDGDANQADPGTEKVLLQVDQPYANHNGGVLAFGPDGYLYIGLGDGGNAGDPHDNGQSLDTLLGKVLRIDVDNGDTYAIPSNNPFAAGGGKPEIWAYGLRNPWRFSFDRLTGDFYIADVGQGAWEEIDFQPANSPGGENYGWNFREGAHEYQGAPPAGTAMVDPVFEYSHGDGCSVTGGFVYRGQSLAEFRGVYLFADYCSGKMWGLVRGADGGWQANELFQTGWNITSFAQDAKGELYVTEQSTGGVYQLSRK